MILIGYDGSSDAQAAIRHAAESLAGQDATVLTVWEPFMSVMARSGAGLGYGGALPVRIEEIDQESKQSARTRAGEGAERARRAGLDAQARVESRSVTVADAILAVADEINATSIVIGTRGLTGFRSLLLGSVSHAVLQHANRPVTVVPSPEVAAARAVQRR